MAEDPFLVIDRMSTLDHLLPDKATDPCSHTAGMWRALPQQRWPKGEKIKAHRSAEAAKIQLDSERHAGNQLADGYANAAADANRHGADEEESYAAKLQAAEQLIHLATDIIALWPTPAIPRRPRRTRARNDTAANAPTPHKSHMASNGAHICSECLQAASQERRLQEQPCPGPVTSQARLWRRIRQEEHRGHDIRLIATADPAHQCFLCTRCGATGKRRAGRLGRRCQPRARDNAAMRRYRKGKHPRTRHGRPLAVINMTLTAAGTSPQQAAADTAPQESEAYEPPHGHDQVSGGPPEGLSARICRGTGCSGILKRVMLLV